MSTRIKLLSCLIVSIFLSISTISAQQKSNIETKQITTENIQELRIRPTLSTADTCYVRHDSGIYWQINGWITGNELYKSYLDPSLTCENAYPYTVTEINMPILFNDSCSMIVSVDVEQVDLSDPNCPFPDSILSISSAYTITIPAMTQPTLYNIWIPLDQPIVVNEPFFAGFFIGDYTNGTNAAPAIVTDQSTLDTCVSYNVWDDTIGFIDLVNNDIYNLPGKLVLYASGVPGGIAEQPDPQITILSPRDSAVVFCPDEIWVHETSGSNIIQYVSFEYSNGGDFVEIGRDYDGTSPLRDQTNPTLNGAGYSINWDCSAMTEGFYTLRTIATDTMNVSDTDIVTIYIEPTPPIADIVYPSVGDPFCPEFDIIMSSNDENISSIDLSYKESNPTFALNLETLNEADFSAYYSAPITAALTIKELADRGYPQLLNYGSPLTTTQLADLFAGLFNININNGAYDEDVFSGLHQYNDSTGNLMDINYTRFPTFIEFLSAFEYRGNPVMLAVGGSQGYWFAFNGFTGNPNFGVYLVSVSNYATGTIEYYQLRESGDRIEINIVGQWQEIEMMFELGIKGVEPVTNSIGSDTSNLDGWLYRWVPPSLTQNRNYYINAKTTDSDDHTGSSTIRLLYDCNQFNQAGDYNGDDQVNISDVSYLVNFYLLNGPEPVGGIQRADANCDSKFNITDLVYFVNYVFGSSGPPCY